MTAPVVQVRGVLRNKKGTTLPEWLQQAISRPEQAPVASTAITRSPSLEHYRNKADFTIGLDAARQVAVGFKMGSFVVSGWMAVLSSSS